LALRVIRAKELDEGDGVLRKTVAFRIGQALSIAASGLSPLVRRRHMLCLAILTKELSI